MRNLKAMTVTLAILSLGLFFGCGSSQDPAEYNNKLMALMNKNETDMTSMNTAMSAHDYQKAETARKTWEGDLDAALKQAKEAGDFKRDDSLKRIIVDGLNAYKRIVSYEYRELIVIRSKDNANRQIKERELLGHINEMFEEVGNTINKASSDFQTKYAK